MAQTIACLHFAGTIRDTACLASGSNSAAIGVSNATVGTTNATLRNVTAVDTWHRWQGALLRDLQQRNRERQRQSCDRQGRHRRCRSKGGGVRRRYGPCRDRTRPLRFRDHRSHGAAAWQRHGHWQQQHHRRASARVRRLPPAGRLADDQQGRRRRVERDHRHRRPEPLDRRTRHRRRRVGPVHEDDERQAPYWRSASAWETLSPRRWWRSTLVLAVGADLDQAGAGGEGLGQLRERARSGGGGARRGPRRGRR